MNTLIKRLACTIAAAMLASLYAVNAFAYGPRDNMSYRHPAERPVESSRCITGLQKVEAYGPRQTGASWFCPAEKGGDDGSVRIDYSGPRPRVMVNR
jgi:hypothetical protein